MRSSAPRLAPKNDLVNQLVQKVRGLTRWHAHCLNQLLDIALAAPDPEPDPDRLTRLRRATRTTTPRPSHERSDRSTTRQAMNDDTPWYGPNHGRPGILGEGRVGEEVWRLRHRDGRVQSCELHEDTVVGTGFDVPLLEDGDPLLSRRCLTADHARYVAPEFEQETRRAGWTPTT
jgi:hypothetical protein